MKCNTVNLTGGGKAFVCTRGRATPRCRWCERTPGVFLCDWKIGKKDNGSPKTCDKPLCAAHAREVAPEKHICPEHVPAYNAWLAARPPKGVEEP